MPASAASNAAGLIDCKPRSNAAWPSSPGSTSSHGVSEKMDARSGATKADQLPVSDCNAGASAAWRGGWSSVGHRRTRAGAMWARKRMRSASRNAWAWLAGIAVSTENHSCNASRPDTAMPGGGSSSSICTPCQTSDNASQPVGCTTSSTRARTRPRASTSDKSCASFGAKTRPPRYRRSSSVCSRFMAVAGSRSPPSPSPPAPRCIRRAWPWGCPDRPRWS